MAKRRWKIEDIEKVVEGENPFIQIGFTPDSRQYRKIGDEWTDGKGVTWKKTGPNSVVRVNKQMDAIRDLVRPRCSVCNKDINLFGDKVDKKVFARTGKCFDCLEIEEQTLKVTGKYQAYEDHKLLKNRLSLLREFRKNVIESINYLKNDDAKLEMVCSNGELITWRGRTEVEPLIKEAEEDLVKADAEIKRVEEELAKFESNNPPVAA